MKKYSKESYNKMKQGAAKGGRAKVKKGLANFWETATPEQKAEFIAKRDAKRWKKDET